MEFDSRKGRTIDRRKPVKVYRNLHKSGVVYSVMQNGLVVGYTPEITLTNAKFIVNAAGREKVRATGRKVVHAFVEGFLGDFRLATKRAAKYNPYKFDTFVTESGEPLFEAAAAQVGATGVLYL